MSQVSVTINGRQFRMACEDGQEGHLTDLARDVITEFQNREPARKIAVEIADGLTARGDARLMQIVLVNLLGNAWKYTVH